jgi:hypothetical protein
MYECVTGIDSEQSCMSVLLVSTVSSHV